MHADKERGQRDRGIPPEDAIAAAFPPDGMRMVDIATDREAPPHGVSVEFRSRQQVLCDVLGGARIEVERSGVIQPQQRIVRGDRCGVGIPIVRFEGMAEAAIGILEWKQRVDHFIRVAFGKEDAVLREFKWTGVLFDETRGCLAHRFLLRCCGFHAHRIHRIQGVAGMIHRTIRNRAVIGSSPAVCRIRIGWDAAVTIRA